MTTLRSEVIVTVTEVSEPEEAPEFTCPPLTVTNSANATLELDTDCQLMFIPPSTTAKPAKYPATIAQPTHLITPRAAPCVGSETETITVTITSASTVLTTITTTESEEPEDFSCPPMAVTNPGGDVLSLDESCSLEFSPAAPTSSTKTTGNSATVTAVAAQNIAPISGHSLVLIESRLLVSIFLGTMAFILIL